MLAAAIAIPLASSITHSHGALSATSPQVGTEPTWGLPFRNYTSVSIGSFRLHGDNFSSVKDDSSGMVFTLNLNTLSNASMDMVLEPEMPTFGITSLVPAVPLANGTVLAVWKTCHVVLIDYHNGWWAIYLHMNKIKVTRGQNVTPNTNIGYPLTIDKTTATCGHEFSDTPHVHFAFLNQDATLTAHYISMAGRTLCGHTVTSTGHLNGLADPYFVVPNCASPDIFGSNLWITGHDADYHCTLANSADPVSWVSNQCHYLQVAINFATRGPYRGKTALVLDHGSEMATAINNAFGICSGTVCAAPKTKTDDPRTQFASEPLLDSSGHPLFSAIIVASDITCGGCDNNDDYLITPDSDAINARASDIKAFYNAGGGILALAGAENIGVFYNFLPIPATGTTVASPFKLTPVGKLLGLLGGSGSSTDINCCPTHNSFQLPDLFLSPYQIAESDSAGLPETMIVKAGVAALSTRQPSHPVQHDQPKVPHN